MSVLSQLLTPISYLKIRQEVKPWFDWYVPLIITVVSFSILFALPKEVSVFGEAGLVFFITDLIKVLTGFYIASLAAIATFNKESMDELLAGSPAELMIDRGTGPKLAKLSRRRFLCYLFGYLAFMSLAIYFIGAAVSLVAGSFASLSGSILGDCLKWVFVFVYLFFTANLLTTTLLGLHFMTDRIHR
jgi:hypothetical protein